MFSPHVVVIGGGLSNAFDLLAPHIRAEITARAMAPFRGVQLVRSQLGDDAGLHGIAASVLAG
jgi:glucokinase